MDIIACLVDDLDAGLLPAGDVGDDIQATWDSMDWVIYTEAADGQGGSCPSVLFVPEACL